MSIPHLLIYKPLANRCVAYRSGRIRNRCEGVGNIARRCLLEWENRTHCEAIASIACRCLSDAWICSQFVAVVSEESQKLGPSYFWTACCTVHSPHSARFTPRPPRWGANCPYSTKQIDCFGWCSPLQTIPKSAQATPEGGFYYGRSRYRKSSGSTREGSPGG